MSLSLSHRVGSRCSPALGTQKVLTCKITSLRRNRFKCQNRFKQVELTLGGQSVSQTDQQLRVHVPHSHTHPRASIHMQALEALLGHLTRYEDSQEGKLPPEIPST